MDRSMPYSAKVVLVAIMTLLLSQRVQGAECIGTSMPYLTEQSLVEMTSSCTTVVGDVIIGRADCSSPCTVTSLSPLENLRSVSGSLVIQCCSALEQITGLNALTSILGTLRMYYNVQMHRIDGFEALESVGNLEISQNGNLTRIGGFSSLRSVQGYLQIDRNQRLSNLDGLTGVTEVGGASLVSGHALLVLYNPALLDLSWLRNLNQIRFGTVHIEGNLLLCYAGYPQWAVGEFNARPPSGDKGIDWRTLLGVRVPIWQYSWGVEGGGYPTLVIQNNAPYDECATALCHNSCTEGAGCLGPHDPDLCGRCFGGSCEIGATPTLASCDPTSIPYWPPTNMPYSLLFGILFAFGGLLLLGLVLFGVYLMVHIGRRMRAGRKGTFNINESFEMGRMELIPTGDSGLGHADPPSSPNSSINVQSSPTAGRRASSKKRSREGNVILTSSSFKQVSPEFQPVITNTTTSTPSSTSAPDISSTTTSTTTTTVSSPSTTSPVHMTARQSVLPDPLHSIPEEEETEAMVQSTPVRTLHKQDTLTRLKKGELMHIPRSMIKLKKEIGKGDFGYVLYAECKRLVSGAKKTPVIVKQLKENASKQEQELFLRPVEAMSVLQHPNVLSLMGTCIDAEPILILMEYCTHGNLKTFLVRKRREAAVIKQSGKLVTIAYHMAAGLAYLHSNNIAHNDFAVRSCLVADDEVVKLGDYGLTKHIFKEDYYSRGGHQKAWPIRWMAPEQMIVRGKEVLDAHPASTTGNVWSFGISLWEVSTFAQWPYFDLSNEEVIDTVQSSQQCSLENPFQPSDMLSSLYDIMQLCWKAENERPTMADVLNRLEAVREDIAHSTPSTASRRKKVGSTDSPKTTPTIQHPHRVDQAPPTTTSTVAAHKRKIASSGSSQTTPTIPHPHRVDQTPPTTTSTAAAHNRPSSKPRRPAPKLPEEGSLKRGTKMKPAVPNNAHHPIEKSIDEAERPKVSQKPRHQTGHKSAGTGMLKANPLFEEVEQQEKGNEVIISGGSHRGLQVEDDPNKGVLFVNRSAEEEVARVAGMEEVERQGMEGEFGEEAVMEAEEEDEDDDFILEPPEEFSQSSVERDDEATHISTEIRNSASYPPYDPSQSSYTSIDDFEPSIEKSLQQPSSDEQQRTDRFTSSKTSHAPITAHMMDVDPRDTRKQQKATSNSKRVREDPSGGKVSQLCYSQKMTPVEKEVEQEGSKMEIDEPDFEDSRYRRPTSRISGLLKRAPSWGRSSTSGDDDMPNVVYNDEVSALIW